MGVHLPLPTEVSMRLPTGMFMEVIVTIVSKLVYKLTTYLPELQPTYIGVK